MSAKLDTRPVVSRCPACGQCVDPPDAKRCRLCDFDFGDDRVTGADVTPYAKAYAEGNPGWWTMCRWVWSAGSERLKHIALMRSSAASRAFALRTSLFLALGAAVFQGTRVGWVRSLRAGPAMKAAGRGWIHAASMPNPIVPEFPAEPFDLWWNPAQALIGAAIAGLSGLLLLWMLRYIIGLGIALAHQRPFRGEQRMSAALLYSTAWGVPALAAVWACLLRPVEFFAEFNRLTILKDHTVLMIAGTIAALSAMFWWFWLIRLSATAPPATRAQVMAFFLLGAPLLVGGAAAGWWYGLEWLYERLFILLNIHFVTPLGQ